MKLEIFIVLDKSGSMGVVAEETILGFNSFIATQKSGPGKCKVTLLQFSSSSEVIHDGVKISNVPELTADTYKPDGYTALLDAIGQGIYLLSERIQGKKRKVIFQIITDGIENASHQYSHEAIKRLIESKASEGWVFQFLGADKDSIRVASGMGISSSMAAQYSNTGDGVEAAFAVLGRSVSTARLGGDTRSISFSDSERSKLAN